jgi:proteasome lid subunit RPN8/RPN11
VDPREQLLAQKWARQRQLQVIGAAHSHPSSAARPSSTDLQLCVGPTLMLIRSGLSHGAQAFGAWWIAAGEGEKEPQARPLQLVVCPDS